MVPSPPCRMPSHSRRASSPAAILTPVCVCQFPLTLAHTNTATTCAYGAPAHVGFLSGAPGAAYLESAKPLLDPLSCVDAGLLASGISQNVHTA